MVACATSSSSENTSLVNPFDSSLIEESKNDITTEETSSKDEATTSEEQPSTSEEETTSSENETSTSEEENTSSEQGTSEEQQTSSEQGTTSSEEESTSSESTSSEDSTVVIPPSSESSSSSSSEDKPSSEVPPAVTKYTVSGKLVDDKGNAIPDATLKLSNSTFTSMSLTNVNGEFTFNDVKAGTYTISITNLENDKWNIEKFTPVTVEVSGTNVNFVVDNVVVPASDIIWGPMFGGN